jgi:hypothetical protein
VSFGRGEGEPAAAAAGEEEGEGLGAGGAAGGAGGEGEGGAVREAGDAQGEGRRAPVPGSRRPIDEKIEGEAAVGSPADRAAGPRIIGAGLEGEEGLDEPTGGVAVGSGGRGGVGVGRW